MSDIKTLRGAADTLKRHCIFQPTDTSDHMHVRMVQIESALELLCRREIERMEAEGNEADAKLITFHTCFFRGDHYDKHDPVDIIPHTSSRYIRSAQLQADNILNCAFMETQAVKTG